MNVGREEAVSEKLEDEDVEKVEQQRNSGLKLDYEFGDGPNNLYIYTYSAATRVYTSGRRISSRKEKAEPKS